MENNRLINKDDPFLTSIPKPINEIDPSIPQADTINTLYSQLNGCISDLDNKVGFVLQKHEADFLNVYKGHMYNIQKEMRILKEKVSEDELKRKRDEELKSLENERDWFRNEALRLDKLCKQHKRNLEIWKNKAQILEEDRKFMENQVLMAKRENLKLLESHESQRELNFSNDKTWIKPDDTLKLSISRPETAVKQQSKFVSTIKHLQSQIEIQKKSMKVQNAVCANYFLEKGELEDFFIDCIEEVKKDIKRRKSQQILYGKSASNSSKSLLKAADEEVSLKEFTVTDKRKVVELIVGQEEVIRMLQEMIFPKNIQKRSRPATGSTHGLTHVFSSPAITDFRGAIRPNTAPKGWLKK